MVLKRDGSAALAWHNSSVVDQILFKEQAYTSWYCRHPAETQPPHATKVPVSASTHTWWIKTNRLFMERAALRELVCCLCPHIVCWKGKRLDSEDLWIQHQPSERLAWNESKSNTELELWKASWYETMAFLFLLFFFFLTKRKKRLFFSWASVWAGREQLQVSWCQLEKLKGESHILFFLLHKLPKTYYNTLHVAVYDLFMVNPVEQSLFETMIFGLFFL